MKSHSNLVNKYVFIVALLLAGMAGNCQTLSTTNKRAIELYNAADNFRVQGNFNRATELLLQAINKDKNFEEAYFRLGLTKKNNADLVGSQAEFENGLKLAKDPKRQSVYYYEMGDNYLQLGNYQKAQESLTAYLGIDKSNEARINQVKVWKAHTEYALAHLKEAMAYSPKALNDTVNSFPMQYFPTLTADNEQLIFTKRNGRGHDDDEDIYFSAKVNGAWTKPISISTSINSSNREGASSISADGRYLIFTVCGSRTYGRCDLFESKKTGPTWSVPINLGPLVNSSAWDAQPTVSADGQELYFISDRKGGLGGSDVWYAKKDSLGAWTRAINLGPTINTRYDEISPYIHVNNRNLYFASNSHPGFGGMDIFVSEKVEKKWTTPKNMGSPLNNFEDQYSFFVTADGRTAYFSKDELGKRNDTKIYVTPLPPPVQVKYYSNIVKGKVTSHQTGLPLKASVALFDIQKDEKVSNVQSDSLTGEYAITLAQGAEYALYSSSPGYLFKSLSFNYREGKHRDPIVVNIELDEIKTDAIVVLNNIFFETDKYDLQAKSVTELGTVLRFLGDNPTIRVEIGGHTDNVGSAAYNLQLSQKRAKSVSDYLSTHGILVDRIVQKGYGSSQPVKPNDSDENRQANRRIEFKIIK